jgi:hypothetical protein
MGLHIEDIRDLFNKGHYNASQLAEFAEKDTVKLPSDHVFDEELSVKRNREMVEEYNQKVEHMRELKRAEQAELNKQLTEDVVEYIKEYYNLSDKHARAVESFVYREHHSFMCDYFSYIDTFADFADELVNMEE